MEELVNIGVFFLGFIYGLVWGYLRWAPDSSFKQGFVKGLNPFSIFSKK